MYIILAQNTDLSLWFSFCIGLNLCLFQEFVSTFGNGLISVKFETFVSILVYNICSHFKQKCAKTTLYLSLKMFGTMMLDFIFHTELYVINIIKCRNWFPPHYHFWTYASNWNNIKTRDAKQVTGKQLNISAILLLMTMKITTGCLI